MKEVYRLLSGKKRRENTRGRWEKVLNLWAQGKDLAYIANWIGKSESTVRQLLKRAFKERQKQPGFKWPVNKTGHKLCDIPYPMPRGANPFEFIHLRATVVGADPFKFRCHVCGVNFCIGKPLIEVLK